MIIGHQKILTYLTRSLEKGTLSHAYLFDGPKGVGKTTAANYFIQRIHCVNRSGCGECENCRELEKGVFAEHLVISGEAGVRRISIKEIRENLGRFIKLKPVKSAYKTIIIEEAEALGEEAVSALLKVLEEPKGNTIFILISHTGKTLPPTILSRVEYVRFSVVARHAIEENLSRLGYSGEDAKKAAAYALGRPGLALVYLNAKVPYETSFQESLACLASLKNSGIHDRLSRIPALINDTHTTERFLTTLTLFLRDLLLGIEGGRAAEYLTRLFPQELLEREGKKYSQDDLIRALQMVRSIRDVITHTNVSPRLALEMLMLSL